MFDHIGLKVNDYQVSKSFYEGALKPLGYRVLAEYNNELAGFGGNGTHPDFWISKEKPASSQVHVAFTSPDRATVDAFYEAALKSGGKDNGAPGLRLHYHANYYAAFVLDPDGNNIEAVCHKPE